MSSFSCLASVSPSRKGRLYWAVPIDGWPSESGVQPLPGLQTRSWKWGLGILLSLSALSDFAAHLLCRGVVKPALLLVLQAGLLLELTSLAQCFGESCMGGSRAFFFFFFKQHSLKNLHNLVR
jgi:hypothetical protein